MENRSSEELRVELMELLRKQSEHLDSRSLGIATDTEIIDIDYELRQEVIHDICRQLANSSAA